MEVVARAIAAIHDKPLEYMEILPSYPHHLSILGWLYPRATKKWLENPPPFSSMIKLKNAFRYYEARWIFLASCPFQLGSGIGLGIPFFSVSWDFVWDLLFRPFALHFAAFWSWKLPFQRNCNILEFEPLRLALLIHTYPIINTY